MTRHFESPEKLADALIQAVGRRLVLALPLGLGKPCHIVNALVERAVSDSRIDLEIFTALTLEAPEPGSEVARRFFEPARQRLFGDYPGLAYARRLRDGTLPDNIKVREFFFLAGRWLGVRQAQAAHISANYTHVLGYMLESGANVLAQLVARRESQGVIQYSLSSNTDLSLDLLKARVEGKVKFVVAAQANSELPFMMGDAEVDVAELDYVLDSPATDFELFSAPRRPIEAREQAIGIHAARLVHDGGTLQLGIGSIGDAVSAALILRHERNVVFGRMIEGLAGKEARKFSDCGVFEEGLYAATEMFVQGLLELVEHGVVRRKVDGALVHAGFFVESRAFYRKLREMSDAERSRFRMTSVSFTNQLYGGEDERAKARVKACFINNAMKATLLGAVISDGLEDGKVVSGVGGQFNFVTQAFALPGARSVLTLTATRESRGQVESNIVWSFAHETIPRHLRDIIITEYGIADLRGRSDKDVIAAMLSVADSRFQPALLERAKTAGKIDPGYQIPSAFRNNRPEAVEQLIRKWRDDGYLSVFPFGTDFTKTEQRLLPALATLEAASYSRLKLAKLFRDGMAGALTESEWECIERMGYHRPHGLRGRIYRILLKGALSGSRNAR